MRASNRRLKFRSAGTIICRWHRRRRNLTLPNRPPTSAQRCYFASLGKATSITSSSKLKTLPALSKVSKACISKYGGEEYKYAFLTRRLRVLQVGSLTAWTKGPPAMQVSGRLAAVSSATDRLHAAPTIPLRKQQGLVCGSQKLLRSRCCKGIGSSCQPDTGRHFDRFLID